MRARKSVAARARGRPHGRGCGGEPTAAPAIGRELFIRASALAFGLVAGLLLLSALAASARLRGGRPGRPTIAGALVLGVVAIAAMAWPPRDRVYFRL